MASIKEYRAKIKSLANIEKMTRTMKLVSASKLRQAIAAQSTALRYARELMELSGRVAASVESKSHPLLMPKEKVKSILVLVISSDKGLCGGFNNNLNRRTLSWLREKEKTCERIELSFCGKRGWMFFRKHFPVRKFYEQMTAKPSFLKAEDIGKELTRLFQNGEFDEIYLAYNRFQNPILQIPTMEKILPIAPQSILQEEQPTSVDYIFEPEQVELLEELIPRFLFFKLYYTLLENSAGEHGARMTAMEKAAKNAGDLIDKYVLLRNRARQAAITTELIEIVSGAEALN